MAMTIAPQEKNDPNDILRSHINPASLMTAIRRSKSFHEDVNVKAHRNDANYQQEALRTLIARAGDHLKPGQVVNFMNVMDNIMSDEAFIRFGFNTIEMQNEIVRFIQDVSNDLERIPRAQAYFLPTPVIGVWRRSSYTRTVA